LTFVLRHSVRRLPAISRDPLASASVSGPLRAPGGPGSAIGAVQVTCDERANSVWQAVMLPE
jgi:hypothetical protein